MTTPSTPNFCGEIVDKLYVTGNGDKLSIGKLVEVDINNPSSLCTLNQEKICGSEGGELRGDCDVLHFVQCACKHGTT
jgi:hypothetical protein